MRDPKALPRRRVIGSLAAALVGATAGCAEPEDDAGTDDDPNENEPEDDEGTADDDDDREALGDPVSG